MSMLDSNHTYVELIESAENNSIEEQSAQLSADLQYSRFELSKSQLCIQKTQLTESLKWVDYTNSHDNIYYENNDAHALSLYLAGGHETQRIDQNSGFGAPGRFCLLPQGAASQWQLGAPQHFVHLYFDDNYLKQLALQVFDIDPRSIQIPELNFTEDALLENLVRSSVMTTDWSFQQDSMLMKQVTDTILVSMLQRMVGTRKTVQFKGGLTPMAIRLVTDFMEANYQRQVYLSELAALVQLSEYHFCRMFKVSLAQTPQAYLLAIRLEHVKRLMINRELSLVEIALQCGFANQSHMGRNFKKENGMTPKDYRRCLFL